MKLVPRKDWSARAPRRVTRRHMDHKSTLHWNGPKVPEVKHERCASLVRGIQNYHMDGQGWNDIAYNFVVCSHGYVFEGRGVNVTNGANGVNDANFNSHAVMCLAGQGNKFTASEKKAVQEVVGYIGRQAPAPAQLVGHRDHKSTECPGNERYSWLKGLGTAKPSRPSKPSGRPVLRRGDSGDPVILLQTILRNKAGGGIVVDGRFGPNTERKVRLLQKFFKLTPDGIVGEKTWEVLEYINNR
jgi:hypothetical protein